MQETQKIDGYLKNELYPSWLLPEPLPLAVLNNTPHHQGPLALLAGPQRLEVGWWAACALRDYYIAQSPQAGLLWVYRERLAAAVATGGKTVLAEVAPWYLHGLFA